VTLGDVMDDERQRVRRQLEQYCSMDMAMVRVVDALKEIALV
jgi:hypothetical protein